MTQDLLSRFDAEERRDRRYPDMIREATPQLVRQLRAAPGSSFIVYSALSAANADATIARELESFRARGLVLDWKVYDHDEPADLGERLLGQGFEQGEREAVMILETSRTPASLLGAPQRSVRRLGASDLRDVIAVESAVWGGDFSWIQARLGAHLELPGYLSVYCAYAGGEPVGCAWTYFPESSSFASLWGGAVVPEARGRGFYTALLAVRAREALERGRTYLVVDAGPMSEPILARHGFAVLTHARDHHAPG